MAKILLSNTEELLQKLKSSYLSRSGFMFMIATSGRDVLSMVSVDVPDLIFLELDLPDMSGAACCHALKLDEQASHVPVVMFAPPGRECDIELCRHVGCDAIMSTPVDYNDFVTTTQKYIQLNSRATPRHPLQIPVQYGVDARHLFTGYSVNLCPGGLFVVTDSPLDRETLLTIEFMLPGMERPIRCKARVAWVNPGNHSRKWILPVGMGLQFLDLLPEDELLLERYVRKPKALRPASA